MKLLLFTIILFSTGSDSGSGGQDQECSLHLESAGTATLRGLVVENHHDCSVDGLCYLTIHCDNAEVSVDYAGTEGGKLKTRNDNDKVAWDIRKGDLIEAFGGYTKGRHGGSLDIFSQERFWVKILSRGSPACD